MLKRFLICCCLGWTLTVMPIDASANIAQQMNDMFNSMSNTTNPQAYLGQSMGALTGGSAIVRNRIVNENILGFIPPHISAGCGGIDMFGGSFSFINAKQLTNLFRSIASNASGYFFQLAMQAMCPTCTNLISAMQKKIQQLNQLANNSCQTAKALVDQAVLSTVPDMSSKFLDLHAMRKAAAQDQAANGVAFSDIFDAFSPPTKKNTNATIAKADPSFLLKKGYIGNIAWDILQHANVKAWMAFGDTDVLFTMMSLTGTVVVSPPNKTITGAGGTADKTSDIKKYTAKIDLNTFVNGRQHATVKMWSCALSTDPQCTQPFLKTNSAFVPMVKRIKDILLGVGGNAGLVEKFRHPKLGEKLTAKEKALTELMSLPMVKVIRSFGGDGETTATYFVNQMAPVVAQAMVSGYVEDMIRAFADASAQATPGMQKRMAPFLAMLDKADKDNFRIIRENAIKEKNILSFFETFHALRTHSSIKRLVSESLITSHNNGDQ